MLFLRESEFSHELWIRISHTSLIYVQKRGSAQYIFGHFLDRGWDFHSHNFNGSGRFIFSSWNIPFHANQTNTFIRFTILLPNFCQKDITSTTWKHCTLLCDNIYLALINFRHNFRLSSGEFFITSVYYTSFKL